MCRRHLAEVSALALIAAIWSGAACAQEALPTIDIASGQPAHVDEEPDALRLTDHHELDLEDDVRDFIILAEPFAPLCREDCPGLCIVCGLELGSGPHQHPDDDIDPRLEGLRGLLQ